MLMEYLKVFLTGGIICAIAQVILDKTKITAARILVLFVCLGVFFTGIGLYQKLVDFGAAGATVPISGFGYSLATGVKEAIDEKGFIGIFTGGVTATSAGIAAAVIFGFLGALFAKPKLK